MGITETDYWNMTFGEVNRAIESRQRRERKEAQIRASFDYILADLIGYSVSRVYNSSNDMPEISEAYPSLFSDEQIKQEKERKQTELSTLRFKQFANAYNAKYQQEVPKVE